MEERKTIIHNGKDIVVILKENREVWFSDLSEALPSETNLGNATAKSMEGAIEAVKHMMQSLGK